MAAVLACGDGAALSHRSAAALWKLLPATRGVVDVTVPGTGGRRRRPGIRLHRSPLLTPAVSTLRSGIAVTTPARTLADLRRVAPPDELRRAIRQAEVLGLEIGGEEGVDRSRSELEHLFLRLCRRHRLPPPEVNVRIGPFLVDFLWRDRRLIAETDGYRFHRGRTAFEDDRARDVELKLLGYEVVRFTHRQVMGEAGLVARTLRALLI
jgi:very-short-patch-repair endonuclease